jgi:hypothetical protein
MSTPGKSVERIGRSAARGAARGLGKGAAGAAGAAVRFGAPRVAVLERRRVPRRLTMSALPIVLGRMFDPVAAGDMRDVFELRIREPDGTQAKFGLRIGDGRLAVERGGAADARAWVIVAAEDMVRLATGSPPWPVLLGDGRLELAGDPFLALRFPKLFGFSA